MTNKEAVDLIKELFELVKLQKEYSEILNKQIVNINAQIETLKKKVYYDRNTSNILGISN